jgi:hypothetical protein
VTDSSLSHDRERVRVRVGISRFIPLTPALSLREREKYCG